MIGIITILVLLIAFFVGYAVKSKLIKTSETNKISKSMVIFDDTDIKLEKTNGTLFIINKTPCTKILKISTYYKKKQYILQYILKPNKKYNVDIYVKVSKIWVDDIKTTIPEYLEI
jgi:hypothetical protein